MIRRRLRIAVITHEFPALSETFVLGQITGLIDLGHDVTVFAAAPRDEPMVHPDVHRYGLLARTRYHAPPRGWPVRAWTAAGVALRLMATDRHALLNCLNVRRFGRLAASGRLLFWSASLAGSGPFDFVLAHFGPVGSIAATLRTAGLMSGKLVTIMHGVDVSAEIARRPERYRQLFESGDLFLPISRFWLERLAELGCDRRRLAVHHMGVDPDRFRFRRRRRDAGDPLTLLTVGRLVEKKGVEFALRAVAELVRDGVDLQYRIVGDGPLRPALERLAELLGIDDRVEFIGWRDQQAVARLIDGSDIMLAPSVTTADGDQEGIPVTLMEAMASGMLTVSTRHSGIPELIDHGRSGMLVAERSCDELAAAMKRLIDDADTWPGMSEAARRKVADEFSVRALNRELVERLEALVGSADRIGTRAGNVVRPVVPLAGGGAARFGDRATGAPNRVP